jgi:hypothetical protein
VTRHLRLAAMRPSHELIVSCAALQALCTVELRLAEGGGAGAAGAVSWGTYWHYEAHGGSAGLRLAAADCILRLALLVGPEAATAPASDADAEAWGAACTGPHAPDARRTPSVLVLALRLAEARADAPLEQLWLWRAFGQLLEMAAVAPPAGSEEEGGTRHGLARGLERERRVLSRRGDEEAVGAASLLWHAMTDGSAGHARLRYAVCDVWRALFGESQPGCFDWLPQPLGGEHVLPGYVPHHEIVARRKAALRAKSGQLQPQRLRLRLQVSDFAGVTRHLAVTGAVRRLAHVKWISRETEAAQLEELEPAMLDRYRRDAERWVDFSIIDRWASVRQEQQ